VKNKLPKTNSSKFSKGAKTATEKPSASDDEKRRKSLPTSKLKKFLSRRRLTTGSSPEEPEEKEGKEPEEKEMRPNLASDLPGASPPAQAQADCPSPAQRPMEEKYKSRRFSVRNNMSGSIIQKKSYRSSTKKNLPMGYVQMRNANLNSSFTSTKGEYKEPVDELTSILLDGLKKPHLCDVALIGKDGVTIGAPSFLLCSHSRVFEDVLLSGKIDHIQFEDAQDKLREGEESYLDEDGTLTIKVPFAAQDAIQIALHFMASHKLPLQRVGDSSEENVRTLTQVHAFAKVYRMDSLAHEVYRTLRVLVNKTGHLASAVFDECTKSMKLAGSEDVFKRSDLKEFVFDSIREKPEEFLIVGGLKYLHPESLEKIVCDQEIDVDEITMFHILFTWTREGPGDREDRLKVAKSLLSNIQLTLMDVKYLDTFVRRSGFVDEAAVDDAIQAIEDHIANLSPEEKEHILVSGAGTEAVNGIYVRMEEDIGLEDEEAVFIKEASEDEIGGDYGLYLWRDSWAISPCVDYSNVLYSRHAEIKRGWNRLRPSADNWITESGMSPAPTCQWNAGADESKCNEKYEAPRLSRRGSNSLSASLISIRDGDHAQAREFSLEDMLNLPTDQDFEGDDYHGVRPSLERSTRSYTGRNKDTLTTKKE